MEENRKEVVILGNGIAGITAARFIRKLSDHKITVISKETEYFYSRTALMYIYMGHMTYQNTKPYEDSFWKKNRINLIRGEVSDIDFEEKQLSFNPDFEVETAYPAPEKLNYNILILATGSSYNVFDWNGTEKDGVKGLYSVQNLRYLDERTPDINTAVIVGGGLIGIELAEMLHTRGKEVHMLVRESSYWDNVLPDVESEMINQTIRDHGIHLHLETELDTINGNGKVSSVTTKSGENIKCEYVGLTAGVHPNIKLFKDTQLETDKGILVNEYLQTNIDNVYAIGDCAQLKNPPKGRKAIEAVWYVGRMMGEIAAYNICDKKHKYEPGVWFNSAKFFNIEYQVYGHMPVDAEDNHDYFIWKDPDEDRCIRIYYEKDTEIVKGFNLMGVRYRQNVCVKWIEEKTQLREVLKNLSLANFDPEFSKTSENELIEKYNQQTGKNIKLESKRGRSKGLLSFLNIS